MIEISNILTKNIKIKDNKYAVNSMIFFFFGGARDSAADALKTIEYL